MPRVKITTAATHSAVVTELTDEELATMLADPCVVRTNTGPGLVRLVVHETPQETAPVLDVPPEDVGTVPVRKKRIYRRRKKSTE